jgi:hypothetical protein
MMAKKESVSSETLNRMWSELGVLRKEVEKAERNQRITQSMKGMAATKKAVHASEMRKSHVSRFMGHP